MQKEETTASDKVAIKNISVREKQERQEKLLSYYLPQIKNFNEIFLFIELFEDKLKIKQRVYYNVTRTTLAILKLFYNAKQDKKEKITNEDLIFIRGVAIKYYKFGFNKKLYNSLKKKDPAFERVPKEYDDNLDASWIGQTDGTNIKKHLDAKSNDINCYIGAIPFDCICYCINLLMIELDGNRYLNSSIPFIEEGIRKYLGDIEIDQDRLLYKECNRSYKGTGDSFNAVFYSTEGKESYVSTRNRFCVRYEDQLKKKYNKLIGKKDENNLKKKNIKKKKSIKK